MKQEITAELEVELDSDGILQSLMGSEALSPGQRATLADGQVQLELRTYERRLGFVEGSVALLVISFGLGVTSGVVANAVYAALGSALKSLTIDGRGVRPKEAELEQALETIRKLVAGRSGNKSANE
jgi:hypothetical protein